MESGIVAWWESYHLQWLLVQVSVALLPIQLPTNGMVKAGKGNSSA